VLHGTGKGRTMDQMLTDMPMHYAGGGFPWGLLIIGGILYFVWRSGMFGGPGRHGNGQRFGGYGPGYGPTHGPEGSGFAPGASAGQGNTPGFSGPRAMFDDWHRQAHETAGTSPRSEAPSTPATPPATAASETAASGDGEPAR
jgi:hypothetical protein